MSSPPTKTNSSTQQRRISSRRLPTIRSGFVVLWIDDIKISLDMLNDSTEFTERIHAIKGCLIIRYRSISKGIKYLKQSRSYERVVLILVMKRIEYATIARFKSYQQIRSIFIVLSEQDHNELVLTEKNGRAETFSTHEMMFVKLEMLLNEPQPYDDGLFIAVNQKEKSLRNVHQELGPFIWSQAFKALVEAMPCQSDEAKQQMLFECRRSYPGSRSELNQIEEFARNYSSNNAINWYTRDCFLYRTINRALRTEDILVLYTYRFFIIDMCKRLEELKAVMTDRYPSAFRAYRGSKLSKIEVEQLGVGTLVATNGFFSCSMSLEIAQIFVGIDPITGMSPSESHQDPEQYVLFEININLVETPEIVVADVSGVSAAPQENEILFSLGTTFMVQQINYDDEHHVWHMQLILSSEVNHIKQQYKKYVRDRLQEYDATMFFGNCLGDILGDYPAAMRFFHRQLRVKPSDDEFRPNTFYQLARVYRCMGLYPQAINYFRRAMLLQRRILPQSGYDYARTISGLAMLYSETGYTKQSLELQTKAVRIFRTYLPEDHEEVAIFYNRLAYVCYQEQQYERAHSLLATALPVLKKKGPLNYTGYATSLDLMGTVKWAMGVKHEAAEYLTEALKMRESFLTKDHPLVARTCYTLAKLYAELEEEHSTAISYALRALRIREAKLSKNHRELNLSLELVQQLMQKN